MNFGRSNSNAWKHSLQRHISLHLGLRILTKVSETKKTERMIQHVLLYWLKSNSTCSVFTKHILTKVHIYVWHVLSKCKRVKTSLSKRVGICKTTLKRVKCGFSFTKPRKRVVLHLTLWKSGISLFWSGFWKGFTPFGVV